MNKNTLRKEILALRENASSDSGSAFVCDLAVSLPEFQKAETVMLYLAKGSELQTSRLLSHCARLGKKVCLPRVTSQTDMEARYFDKCGLLRGAFRIWEPMGKVADKIDIIFVPGVVFDKKGNRIGYGKGYYDRFLAKHKNARKVGLAYSCQVTDSIFSETTDIPVDILLTEKGRLL